MSQNWHGDTLTNDQLNSMVTAIDTLINGMR